MKWRNTEFVEASNPPSPNERWGAGSTGFTRTIRLLEGGSYQVRSQAAYDFLGYGAVLEGEAGPYISRIVPYPYPSPPEPILPANDPRDGGGIPLSQIPPLLNTVWTVGISKTTPIGVPTGLSPTAAISGTFTSEYYNSLITLEGSTLPYPVLTDAELLANGGVFLGNPDEGVALASFGWSSSRYIHRHREPFSRLIKLPTGYLYSFAGGKGTPLKQSISSREAGTTIRYTWYRVPIGGPTPGYDPVRISEAQGRINDNYFDGMEPGTLLLDTYETREYQGSFGEWLADVTFTMIHLPHPATGYEPYSPVNIIQTPYGVPITPGIGGQPLGWNYVLDMMFVTLPTGVIKRVPVYVILSTDPNSEIFVFQSTDFSALFRP